MSAATRLHPDDIEAIAEAIERRIKQPAKAKAKAVPVVIDDKTQNAANDLLEARGLAPRPRKILPR